MNTKNSVSPQSTLKAECPYCGEKTPVKRARNYKSFYAHCVHCKEKFVVEPIRDGIDVFSLEEVPYGSDPDCQALERGQSDEE